MPHCTLNSGNNLGRLRWHCAPHGNPPAVHTGSGKVSEKTWSAAGFASGRFSGGGSGGGFQMLVNLVPSLVFDVLDKLGVGWSPLFGGKRGGLSREEGLTEGKFVKFGMLRGTPGFNRNILGDPFVAKKKSPVFCQKKRKPYVFGP